MGRGWLGDKTSSPFAVATQHRALHNTTQHKRTRIVTELRPWWNFILLCQIDVYHAQKWMWWLRKNDRCVQLDKWRKRSSALLFFSNRHQMVHRLQIQELSASDKGIPLEIPLPKDLDYFKTARYHYTMPCAEREWDSSNYSLHSSD